MSEEQPDALQMTVPGDWWYLAAAARQMARVPTKENSMPSVETLQAGHYTLIIHNAELARPIGSLMFVPGKHSTTLHVRPATVADAPYWNIFSERLHALAYEARRLRDRTTKPTAEELIERYYRTRAAGRTITLRELAEEHGFSVSYLSQVKVAYDKAGKWGSKNKGTP